MSWPWTTNLEVKFLSHRIFSGSTTGCGFDIRGDVFKIVLALAPVPDPVFGEGPGIYFEEEGIQVWHIFRLRTGAKYLPLSLLSFIDQVLQRISYYRPVTSLNTSPVLPLWFVSYLPGNFPVNIREKRILKFYRRSKDAIIF